MEVRRRAEEGKADAALVQPSATLAATFLNVTSALRRAATKPPQRDTQARVQHTGGAGTHHPRRCLWFSHYENCHS